MDSIVQTSIVYGGTGPKGVVYTDAATFTKYYCDTQTTTTLKLTPNWRVKKVVYDGATFDNVVSRCNAGSDGTASYNFPANSLAVVQGLTYLEA